MTFTQLSALEYTYRDAVRFQNGHDVLLQKLPEGQRVKVLDLSSAEALEPSPERIEGLSTKGKHWRKQKILATRELCVERTTTTTA